MHSRTDNIPMYNPKLTNTTSPAQAINLPSSFAQAEPSHMVYRPLEFRLLLDEVSFPILMVSHVPPSFSVSRENLLKGTENM